MILKNNNLNNYFINYNNILIAKFYKLYYLKVLIKGNIKVYKKGIKAG